MITHVAIRTADGTVYALPKPARHFDVMSSQGTIEITVDGKTCTKWKLYDGEQGFLDDQGRFHNRKQARAHAYRCGQHTGKLKGSVLTSEDLW